VLLDSVTEPYAFVLPDLLDTLEPLQQPPLIELAPLWETGAPQPAWVELLRARRYHVESDGAGRMRLILPYNGPPQADAAEAAEQAYRRAWPVLRHVFAAERQRLAAGAESLPPLKLRIHAYMHARHLSLFRLGRTAFEAEVEDTRPDGGRAPLDMARPQAFLDERLQLEGGRIDEDGKLELLGSRADDRVTLLGEPVALSDLAVAYRAVFHGGMAEPSMSLERAFSPWMTVVTYGGRLRDTRLGMVSLLCDIRFKTFSLGLGIVEGVDLRERVRELLPGFRSHLERFAADQRSTDVRSQQTRLWFYPDNVDVTLSNQGDLLAMRAVRMTATSERVAGRTGGTEPSEDPPWTLATVKAINEDYETLATIFPEMADLDQVVRLLAFFTWLREAQNLGLAVPELDALLALELPAVPTPRLFPRLLSFNALPPAGSGDVVDAFARVPVGEAMERLDPSSGRRLSSQRRLRRILTAIDPNDPENARLIEEIRGSDFTSLDDVALDDLTYRAERLRLHQTVISTLDPSRRDALTARQEAGTQLRVYSVGIGGLDLGMQSVIERARSRSLGLTGASAVQTVLGAHQVPPGSGQRVAAVAPTVRDEWRRYPPEVPVAAIPAHGLGGSDSRAELAGGWIERRKRAGDSPVPLSIWAVFGAYGPEVVSRKVTLEADGRAAGFERVDHGRFLSYRLEPSGGRWKVVGTPSPARAETAGDEAVTLPAGLALLSIARPNVPCRVSIRCLPRSV
jgi:hypothetical protein